MSKERGQTLGAQAYEKAAEYELDYGGCPQCVLAKRNDGPANSSFFAE